MSNILKNSIVKALEHLALDTMDDRSRAASYELCVCYLSGFGVTRNNKVASQWLIDAAQRGEPWARAAAFRLLEAMQEVEVLEWGTLEGWLVEAAGRGSWMALDGLRQRSSSYYQNSLLAHHAFFQATRNAGGGSQQNLLAAIAEADEGKPEVGVGKNDAIPYAAFSEANGNGDSLLMRACRVGDTQTVHKLLDLEADVNQINKEGENCLHLLACLHRHDVESVASRLFEAGIDWRVEARGSSMATAECTLDMRPVIAGCPLVRAVAFNEPKILEILLQLESRHEGQLTARQTKVRASNIRKLVALACRLNYTAVLVVIARKRQEAFESQILNGIGYWNNRRLYSLAALTIAGYVSEHDGFDLPEKFWRSLNNGGSNSDSLTATLSFLRSVGVDLTNSPCGGERNALFFAIRHGRQDAVGFLLSNTGSTKDFEPFGSMHLSRSWHWPKATATALPSYPNHRHKMGLVDAIRLAISQGHLEIFRTLLRWSDAEALDWGALIPVAYVPTSWPRRTRRYHNTGRGMPKDVRGFYPVSVYDKGGDSQGDEDRWVDDAEGKTVISEVEAISTASKPAYYPTAHHVLEPIQRAQRSGSFTFGRPDSTTISDGRLNYGLLYMSLIANAPHRDLDFA
jgi:hypothetical protein